MARELWDEKIIMNMNRSRIYFAVLVALMLVLPALSFAQVGISITIGPPALPVYAQPPCPAPGYVWTPGYWAYGPAGYFWVPGTWVVAPVGLLWTPGYWGWGGGVYVWHAGYWGPHVGFYGGINYGYGYGGVGYQGGYWNRGAFYYNRSVNNVNVTNVTNVYNTTVINNNTNVNRVSYNGGTGGTTAVATPLEQAAARERHTAALPAQMQQRQLASNNRELLASVNHGAPSIAATARPGQFSGAGVVRASATSEANRPNNVNNRNAVPRPPASANNSVANTRPQQSMNTSVPRPGNSSNGVARPGNTQSSVPRPPTSYSSSGPGSSRNPGNTGSNNPDANRSQSSYNQNSQRGPQYGSVPRPTSPPRPEAQGQPQGRPQMQRNPTAHPGVPSPEPAARPEKPSAERQYH